MTSKSLLTFPAAPVFKACNWAVGTFCFAGIASYEYCLVKRRIEKANMKRAVEIIDLKKAEKEAKMQKAREERRRAKEEADRKAEEEAKPKTWSSWEFW
jgi:cytochrome c oxidase assembly protein subunit 20